MDKNELRKKLNSIIEKRKKCIPLTNDEEQFVTEHVEKLYLSKFGDKKVSMKTGDELRKASSFEGTPPKNQGFKGGYDRKADVNERTAVARDGKNTAGNPTRRDPEAHSEEGKQTPKEDNSGKIKADNRTEEYADVDGKKYVPPYEEERLADQLEGKHKYDNSLRIKDIVVKSVRSMGQDIKLVGQILKLYKGGQAALVKWAVGTMSHEVAGDLRVLKSVVPKTEDKEVSPPVKKVGAVNNAARAIVRANTHFGRVEKGRIGSVIRAARVTKGKKPSPFSMEAISESEGVRSPGKGPARTGALGYGANVGDLATRTAGFMAHDAAQAAKTRGARVAGVVGGYADRTRQMVPKKMTKGEKPPSEWLDQCVERVKEKGGADEPYAVCVASYNKMKNKGVLEGDILKISVDDMREICPPCAEKMLKSRIKFYKVTISDIFKKQ